MIDSAAARQPPEASPFKSAGKCVVSRSASRGTPITPVEATKTSAALPPTSAAACSAMARVALAPTAPVKAFELPALTTRARALPRPRFRGLAAPVHRRARHLGAREHARRRRARGQDRHHQVVAVLVLIAVAMPPSVTPGMASMFGNRAGARGETVAMTAIHPCEPTDAAALYGTRGLPASGEGRLDRLSPNGACSVA